MNLMIVYFVNLQLKNQKKIAREKIARAVANSLEIIVDIQRIKNKDKIEKELKKSFKN